MFGTKNSVTTGYKGDDKVISANAAQGLTMGKKSIKLRFVSDAAFDVKVQLTPHIRQDTFVGALDEMNVASKAVIVTDGNIYAHKTDGTVVTCQSLTEGISADMFVAMIERGAIQLTEIKVTSQEYTGQVTREFAVRTFDGQELLRDKLNTAVIKGQELNDPLVAGPFKIPGILTLDIHRGLEYVIEKPTGANDNVVDVELFYDNYITAGDILTSVLKKSLVDGF